ncbi:SET domain-containing protein [Madurella fahalii]|uniref:SET domain-containing protein n=1 Tax=Madurella fahalii TaxID=1157608 RepID=A0ABQ0G0N8_9PEZI
MASASKTPTNEVFDAAKHGKPPPSVLSSAPQDAPAVQVGFVSPTIGYGLFAARDFAKDEFIFHEAPMMTALFNEKFSADENLMRSQVRAYRIVTRDPATRDVVACAFPSLVARNGIAPAPFDNAAAVLASPAAMGRNLVHGRFAGSTITKEQYESYTARLPVVANPSEADAREACLDFFKHYAFAVPQTTTNSSSSSSSSASATTGGSRSNASSSSSTTTTRNACIYLLGSLINHCCTPAVSPRPGRLKPSAPAAPPADGPNCTWRIGPSGLAHFVRPRHILVQARRAIRAGEQLTWDYGKRDNKGFACECDTCRDAGLLGLGSMAYRCRVL